MLSRADASRSCLAAACFALPQEWELLSEVPLLQQGGTGGAAQPTQQAAAAAERQGPAQLSPGDVSITWRGDGLYFATASLDSPGGCDQAAGRRGCRAAGEAGPRHAATWLIRHACSLRARSCRQAANALRSVLFCCPPAPAAPSGADAAKATVRIWERQTGELHASGETAPGLLAAAAWQPNGRHLFVASSVAGPASVGGEVEVRAPAVQTDAAARTPSRPQEGDNEQARLATAEGIAHVGAWKRELRRRQAEREAAGGSSGAAADRPAAGAVLLFERNGLRHGGFELPAAEGACIEQLAWSPDSEFLAVVLREDWEHSERQGRGLLAGAAGTAACTCWQH